MSVRAMKVRINVHNRLYVIVARWNFPQAAHRRTKRALINHGRLLWPQLNHVHAKQRPRITQASSHESWLWVTRRPNHHKHSSRNRSPVHCRRKRHFKLRYRRAPRTLRCQKKPRSACHCQNNGRKMREHLRHAIPCGETSASCGIPKSTLLSPDHINGGSQAVSMVVRAIAESESFHLPMLSLLRRLPMPWRCAAEASFQRIAFSSCALTASGREKSI